jgi:SH3-like domain-containing protein
MAAAKTKRRWRKKPVACVDQRPAARTAGLNLPGKSCSAPGMWKTPAILTLAGAPRRRLAICALALAIGLAAGASVRSAAAGTLEIGPSGLPLPRFVSLKSDRVNLRRGPGVDYPTAWVFRRAGLPLEVVNEFESWRQVRDADGTTGWVLGTMLSGRRTALVLPWESRGGQGTSASATLREDAGEASRAVAEVEAGVLVGVIGCDGRWCRVSVDGHRGFIEQAKLWGVYKGELIK